MTRPRDERFTALAAVIGAHRQSSVVAMIRSSARTPRARGVISLLAGFALLASLAAAPMVRAASTLYVGPGGGSGACASPAYSAIQAGVNAAIAGDTIHVCAATYNLVAAISVPVNLTFEGDGAVSTIIDGSNGDAPVQILLAIGRTER